MLLLFAGESMGKEQHCLNLAAMAPKQLVMSQAGEAAARRQAHGINPNQSHQGSSASSALVPYICRHICANEQQIHLCTALKSLHCI